jgi:pseudouridine synthase
MALDARPLAFPPDRKSKIKMRLQSFLAQAGVASRRSIVAELEVGKVKVNGDVVRIPSYPIFPDKDEVKYMDQVVTLSGNKLYFVFNKPRGIITTAKDTHGRKTVLDYFKDVKARLYPVGRLDQDTTGLLLLTNDGDLANKLMHPRYGVKKLYEAVLSQELTQDQISQLEQGVVIEGEKTAPCKMKILNVRDKTSKVEVVLHEGKKRQIRLMFQSIGIRVLNLHRKKYGPLDLRGLTPGKKRPLNAAEIQMLKNLSQSRESQRRPERRRRSPSSR